MRALVGCLLAGGLVAAACSSTTQVRSAPTTAVTSTSVADSTSTSSTVALQTTVPDCGSGAYRPATLLVTCVSGGITVTGIQWGAWGPSGASGVGTVHMTVGGRQESDQADLSLSKPANTADNGPQFTVLTLTWIGRSPDGHPTDTYQLGSAA